ncbi:MAG: nucleotidyl transferase AbiEii/AbiGii toxin family protein [Candidatus Methanofastidiosia archaeon]
MIPSREIREKAREYGVPETTIERDYAQNWLLKHLSSINMILKGGTGIRKVYIENYRFSDDLDFTLLENVNKEILKSLVMKEIFKAKEESGINFNDEIQIEENINGFMITSYFRILRRSGTPMRIKLDFTKNEREKIVLPLETKNIIHSYSDDCQFQIKAYSLEEIMAEKTRSLFERTRPRDLYDVWYLNGKVDEERMLSILGEKCRFKNVELNISSLVDRESDFVNAWKNSLRHQLKELPEFDHVFQEVTREVKKYKIPENL